MMNRMAVDRRVFGYLCVVVVASGLVPAWAGDVTTPNWDRYIPAALPGEKVAVYFSNGDNEIMFNTPPVDSPRAIDEVLDLLQRAYGVERVYWRAPQIDQIVYRSEIRKQASHHGPWLDWMDHLFADLGTGDYMMRAARERGMAVWGVASLFDHGSQAYIEYPNKGMGPFFTENQIRVEHPEWAPIDRAGILRMSGPICFAYPDARAALVRMYADMVKGKGYEGLIFHLYNENQGPRFDDEFGFNEPIREAYRERYGVDILHEDYDKQKLSDLRGEYLTQFFRELRDALQPMGVKVGVMLDAKHPDEPQRWLAFPDVRLSGRVTVDWRTYARERLVDELFVYFNGSPYATLRQVMKEADGAGMEFSTLASAGFPDPEADLREAGVWRTISGQNEQLEYGYPDPQPAEALDGDDFVARLSVLSQMGAGTTPADLDRVMAATHDGSVLVRRRALRALVSIADRRPEIVTEKVVARVEQLLDDPENIVRCTAVNTLAHLGGSPNMSALYDAFGRHASPMMQLFPAAPLASFPETRQDDLAAGMRHPTPQVRSMVINLVATGTARPALWPDILANAGHDDWHVRWSVARALEFIHPPQAAEVLLGMLDDPHATVRNMAARNLANRLAAETRWVGGLHRQAIDKLTAMFADYGQSSAADDAEWGWRGVGIALRKIGPRGVEALQRFLVQVDDPVLAHRAWHALYVEENDFDVKTIEIEEAEQAYRQHPSQRTDAASIPLAEEAEPAWMPYIVEDFDDITDAVGGSGSGDAPSGQWPADAVLVPAPVGDGNCLRLTAKSGIESIVDAKRLDYRVSQGKLRIRFSMKRESEAAEVTAWATSSNQWEGGLRVMAGPDGVSYFDEAGRAIASGVDAAAGRWYQFELIADLDRHRFSIDMLDADQRRKIAEDVSLSSDLSYFEFNTLVFIPGGENGARSYIDQVVYEVSNPFASHEPE